MWAYADERGLDTLWSEDFQDGRLYGRVKVQNPFRLAVNEPAFRTSGGRLDINGKVRSRKLTTA